MKDRAICRGCKKVLVCCVKAPWPPSGGVDLRCWEAINLLSQCARTGVFALTGRRTPPPGTSDAVWHVLGRDFAPPDQRDNWLGRQNGLPSDIYYDDAAAAELRSLLERFEADVVVLDQLWMQRYACVARSAGARLVLNAHNVEAALARELAATERHPPARLLRKVFAERVAKIEGELVNRADQVWVCSEQDRRLMTERYQPRSVHVVPNAVEVDRYRGQQPPRPPAFTGTGPFFLFSGVFHYAPNQNAATFLIRDLFPRLAAKHQDARLLLVGMDPTPEMLAAAAADERIVVTGAVPDMAPYLRHASLMLVPLAEGGGTRFKIIEAFAAGLPVVSSPKGAEGLGAEARKHLLLATNVDEFLEATAEILSGGPTVRARTAAASELADSFSWATAALSVEQALASL